MRRFKDSFRPDWTTRHLAVRSILDAPEALLAARRLVRATGDKLTALSLFGTFTIFGEPALVETLPVLLEGVQTDKWAIQSQSMSGLAVLGLADGAPPLRRLRILASIRFNNAKYDSHGMQSMLLREARRRCRRRYFWWISCVPCFLRRARASRAETCDEKWLLDSSSLTHGELDAVDSLAVDSFA